MASRGFSLTAGMISVATLTAMVMFPFQLSHLGTRLSRAEYTAFSQGLDSVANRLSLAGLARLARRHAARQEPVLKLSAPQLAPPVASPWTALARGVRYRSVKLVAQSGEAMQVHQVRLDPRVARLRVLYRDFAGPVASTAKKSDALAAVNASYFDTERRPLGYLKIGGKVVNGGVATGAAFTGVFTMSGATARIVSRAAFDGHVVDTALQAGPRLVADGVPTSGLKETRSFRQSGIAVTRAGDVIIYATDGSYRGITWREMQSLLTGPATAGGIDARDVLNFDGGSSSQMYVRLKSGEISTGFPTAVPVVVAVSGK